jgi:hypothetical protein
MATKLTYLVTIAVALLLVAVPSAGASLIAPPAACPSQLDASAPATTQERTMRCMTDFARARVGLGALADSPQLDLSAEDKGSDVLRCNSFSHTACGREFTYWMREAGYMSEACSSTRCL